MGVYADPAPNGRPESWLRSGPTIGPVADPELPEEPVVAWREARTPWWSTLIGAALLSDAGDRDRDLTVPVNGVTTGNRFLRWDEIAEVVEADDPDLAAIWLTDGTSVRLDKWHLPTRGEARRQAKAERLALLRAALSTSRGEACS